jgi:hypothetical protein
MNSSKDAHPGASPWLYTIANIGTCITARLQIGIQKVISFSLNHLNSYNLYFTSLKNKNDLDICKKEKG